MPKRVRVSSKNQIAVPSEVRKSLGIRSGDSLLFEVRGSFAILRKEPADHCAELRGLHMEVWKDLDAETFVRQERGAWEM